MNVLEERFQHTRGDWPAVPWHVTWKMISSLLFYMELFIWWTGSFNLIFLSCDFTVISSNKIHSNKIHCSNGEIIYITRLYLSVLQLIQKVNNIFIQTCERFSYCVRRRICLIYLFVYMSFNVLVFIEGNSFVTIAGVSATQALLNRW